MSSERINGCRVNLAVCSESELQNMQQHLGQMILEREWELSLVITELDSRKEATANETL